MLRPLLLHLLAYLLAGPLAWLMLRGYVSHADWLTFQAAYLADVSRFIVHGRGPLAEALRAWQLWWEGL